MEFIAHVVDRAFNVAIVSRAQARTVRVGGHLAEKPCEFCHSIAQGGTLGIGKTQIVVAL